MPGPGLRELWDAHPEWRAQEQRAAREAALPDLRGLIDDFRADRLDLTELRKRIDSQSKQRDTAVWGFRGNAGVMFFTMLWKGAPDEFAPLLRTIIAAPSDAAAARDSIDQLRSLARATKERTGNRNIHERFAPFFLSFFWEAQDRSQWPMFHPASREGLDRLGRVEFPSDVSAAYIAFREAMLKAVRDVEAVDVWDLEQFFWSLKESLEASPGADTEPADAAPASAAGDLYAALSADGLRFPDDVVTTVVLSLLAKPFVILAGISGTGKTQLPLRLARYLEAQSAGEPAAEPPPESDEHTLHLKITPSTLRYGVVTVPSRLAGLVALPDRGKGDEHDVTLPSGRRVSIRLENIGFSNEAARHARVTVRGAAKTWLTERAQPDDILSVSLDQDGRPTALAHQRPGRAAAPRPVQRHELIAVRSDWTDPRGLIGYWNPLTERYNTTRLVELCLRAAADPGHPYIVILDEMNLARVEYYFSDFLSAIESGEPIPLFDPSLEEAEPDVPSALAVPPNVLFVGTVNVDETTFAFSPKVLDRANVVEFDEVDAAGFLGAAQPAEGTAFRLEDDRLEPSVLAVRGAPSAEARAAVTDDTDLVADLLRLHAVLEGARRHFGYRVLDELVTYLAHAAERVSGEREDVLRRALDRQLVQKVLPKLNGGRELQETLEQLLAVCAGASPESVDPYPLAARKLRRMVRRLSDRGYVTFLE
jgi:hypothetical protein